mgnify:FL=1
MRTSFLVIGLVVFSLIGSVSFGSNSGAHCDENGCTITICAAEDCEVRHCIDGTCSVIAAFPNPNPGGVQDFEHCGQERCAIRTCNDRECSVVGFERGRAYEIARFPNTQKTVDELVSIFLEEGSSEFEQLPPGPRAPSEFRED